MKRNRFFCEHCHREVKPNAKICPHCGRWFTAVQCPKCGFSGDGPLFINGCPRCGFLAPGTDDYPGSLDDQFEYLSEPDQSKKKKPKTRRKVQLPSWFYVLSLVILSAALIALLLIYLNL